MGSTNLLWQTHPERPHLFGEVIEWFEASGEPGVTRHVATRAANSDATRRLGDSGYVHDPGAPWFHLLSRTLDDLDAPQLPPGLVLKTAIGVEPDRAVQAHRAAWAPSEFSVESLNGVRHTWPYRDDLSVFVEAPNGELVASALVWLDEINRTAELEPVGTDSRYRGQGLGRAVSLFGLRQAHLAGAKEGIVSCRGDENYPIPQRLYRSVGFHDLTQDLVFAKPTSVHCR
jgi:GNAT superfamily N-acetyltransferase